MHFFTSQKSLITPRHSYYSKDYSRVCSCFDCFLNEDFVRLSKSFQITGKTYRLLSILSLADTVIWNDWEIPDLGGIQKLCRHEGEGSQSNHYAYKVHEWSFFYLLSFSTRTGWSKDSKKSVYAVIECPFI